MVLILFSIINAFIEEIYWRGFILDFTFSSKTVSSIYSIILFTLSHFVWGITSYASRNIYMIISVLIMAIFWTIIRLKTKSIWWCIFSHLLVDIFSLSTFALMNIYIPPSTGILY
jgi:membrane protease YdiL (CAAX protease family)